MEGSNRGPQASARPVAQTNSSDILQALHQAKLHKRPRVVGVALLWLFGLYAVFLSPAPVKMTEEKLQRFEKKLKILEQTDKPRLAAEQRWMQAEREVWNAKVWFWRFKAKDRERVNRKKAKSAEMKKDYGVLEKRAKKELSNAKAELGLWSEAGISEGRKIFWKSFELGKKAGRDQTVWDSIIMVLTSREEGMIGMLIQIIIRAAINFTAGMVASIFVFLFKLPSFLWSYQPSLVSGLAFFVIATLGAVSVIASFLLALYGAGATAVYSLATLSPNRRINMPQHRRRHRLGPHYD